jgi:hypothetical protein
MVKPENRIMVNFYRGLGFVKAGKSILLAEALIANGDASLLQKDPRREKYNTRAPLIMISDMSR